MRTAKPAYRLVEPVIEERYTSEGNAYYVVACEKTKTWAWVPLQFVADIQDSIQDRPANAAYFRVFDPTEDENGRFVELLNSWYDENGKDLC